MKRFGGRLVLHASILEHVRPFAAGPMVAMLEVLSEMIGPEELLRLIAFPKIVYVVEVFGTVVPLRWVWELFSTVAACVCMGATGGRMESSFYASQYCAGPGVKSEV